VWRLWKFSDQPPRHLLLVSRLPSPPIPTSMRDDRSVQSPAPGQEIPALSPGHLVWQLPSDFPGFFQRHNLRTPVPGTPITAATIKPLTQSKRLSTVFFCCVNKLTSHPSIRHRPISTRLLDHFHAQHPAPFIGQYLQAIATWPSLQTSNSAVLSERQLNRYLQLYDSGAGLHASSTATLNLFIVVDTSWR